LIATRARIYDALALLTAIIIITLDQWTKSLVVARLGPPGLGPQVPLVGQYLVLYYIRNTGAAFSMFETNGPVLIVLIAVAVAVIVYLYVRMLNSGSMLSKLIFGLIIGGAAGNLLDRFLHGSVVDFIWFRIPQINYSFAIFNIADSAISIGVVLLFCILLLSSLHRKPTTEIAEQPAASKTLLPAQQIQEQDAQP
jgi:signal peptidase II